MVSCKNAMSTFRKFFLRFATNQIEQCFSFPTPSTSSFRKNKIRIAHPPNHESSELLVAWIAPIIDRFVGWFAHLRYQQQKQQKKFIQKRSIPPIKVSSAAQSKSGPLASRQRDKGSTVGSCLSTRILPVVLGLVIARNPPDWRNAIESHHRLRTKIKFCRVSFCAIWRLEGKGEEAAISC